MTIKQKRSGSRRVEPDFFLPGGGENPVERGRRRGQNPALRGRFSPENRCGLPEIAQPIKSLYENGIEWYDKNMVIRSGLHSFPVRCPDRGIRMISLP